MFTQWPRQLLLIETGLSSAVSKWFASAIHYSNHVSRKRRAGTRDLRFRRASPLLWGSLQLLIFQTPLYDHYSSCYWNKTLLNSLFRSLGLLDVVDFFIIIFNYSCLVWGIFFHFMLLCCFTFLLLSLSAIFLAIRLVGERNLRLLICLSYRFYRNKIREQVSLSFRRILSFLSPHFYFWRPPDLCK